MGLFGKKQQNSKEQIKNLNSDLPATSEFAIDPGAIVSRFGTDRLNATKYIANEKGIKLKDATKITAEIYNDYLANLAATWNPTHKINKFFEINEELKMFAIAEPVNLTGTKMRLCATCHFDDVLNYELLEDGNGITSGGIGAAAAGGFLFGETGAIVGSVVGKKKTKKEINTLKIKITKKNLSSAPLYINLLIVKTTNGSAAYMSAYNNAQQILSILDQITAEQSKADAPDQANLSPADEIRKYKELLDEGILTQEEFDLKKKELLGL